MVQITLGLIVGNRGFFPGHLAEEGRAEVIQLLEEQGIRVVALSPDDTSYGSVESYEDAIKCAELFKAHREEIDGVLVTLPNFGDERAVVNTLRLAGLDVPVLVHAFADEPTSMTIKDRRDSFCGKMSVCNNLKQYGIPFSLTTKHTVAPSDPAFLDDVIWFAGVCRVRSGLKNLRLGAIGTRPPNFNTVRYSEKLLENAGISVEPIDLSEIFGRIQLLSNDDADVNFKLQQIRQYVSTELIPEDALLRMAQFGVVVDRWMADNHLAGTAIQCWTSMEEYFGVVPCAIMSMMSNNLIPSACEVDVPGLVGMYALQLASQGPSALLDWNNNYGDSDDKGVVFHCSNLPKAFFGEAKMDYQEIIAGTVGKENTYGTVVGRVQPGAFTYARVSTDDFAGRIKAYIGEGRFTADPLSTFGGYGVVEIPGFQALLRHICENGFEHHVAMSRSQVARILDEAFRKYMGWDVYHHRS